MEVLYLVLLFGFMSPLATFVSAKEKVKTLRTEYLVFLDTANVSTCSQQLQIQKYFRHVHCLSCNALLCNSGWSYHYSSFHLLLRVSWDFLLDLRRRHISSFEPMASKTISNSAQNFIPFNDPEASNRLLDVARKELGETEELKNECLRKLKILIKEHRVTCISKDDFLLRFLRTKKFRVQQSFEALQNYAHQRATFHKRLLQLSPEVVRTCFELKCLGILPFRDAQERLIIFYDTGVWNPSICSAEEMVMVVILLLNYASEKQSSQITGVSFIFDNKVIPLSNLPYLVPNSLFLKRFAWNSLPMKFHKIHSINESFLIRNILLVLRPLMPRKLKKRILYHGKTREVLFQHFSPNILPEDFNGTLDPLSNDHLTEEMVDYFQKMKVEQQYFIP